ncbi:MAG: hypothetical protein OJF61_001570 [Rhodanobacteraceae bacterium]|nr:MAG: hypothetical protein OJF61_001570 [Rhodanobacteraceae bacterium]
MDFNAVASLAQAQKSEARNLHRRKCRMTTREQSRLSR